MAIYDENGLVKDEDLTSAPVETPREKVGAGESALRGFSNAATLGLGKYIQAPINELITPSGKDYWSGVKSRIDDEVTRNAQASQDNPWTYGAGSVVGAAPMALGAASLTLPKAMVAGAAGAGTTTYADTQDLGDAAKSAALGGVLPAAMPVLGKVVQAAKPYINNAATEKVAGQVEQLAKGGQAKGVVKGGKVIGTETRPGALATAIREEGLDVLNQPQWAAIKELVQKQNPSGIIPNLKGVATQTMKNTAMGGGAGAAVGMAPVGAAVGTATGLAQGAKNAAANRVIQKTLSPSAKVGQSKLQAALTDPSKTSQAIGHGSRWAAITNVMNQQDPQVRAALNSESPLNKDQEE